MSQVTRNAVYDYVSKAITAVHTNAHCTSRNVRKPSAYPSCYIHEIDHYRPLENIQLDYQDVQWQSSFEIRIISNKKGTAESEAYSILDTARSAFNEIYYRELSATPIDGTETFTIVARFRRTIGGGDSMPKS
jgi:hypothetical protein